MVFKFIVGATCTCLTVVCFNANSAIVSVDWKTAGDNLITRDTDNGMEWLDLSVTTNRSWNDIWSELSVGGEFEGWQFAGTSQLTQFFNAFGGDGYYDGFPVTSASIFNDVALYWGDTLCQDTGCNVGEGWSKFYTGNIYGFGNVWQGFISDSSIDINSAYVSADIPDARRGSALFRYVSPVPIPAAFWLFVSGLVGLIGLVRRKKRIA